MTSQECYDADPIFHEIFSTSSELMVPSDMESKQKTKQFFIEFLHES